MHMWFKLSLRLLTTTLSIYCKCGHLVETCNGFGINLEHDEFTLTLMLVAYAKQGASRKWFKVYMYK
jgi:hypothetical protein